jgi:hypothetical protein
MAQLQVIDKDADAVLDEVEAAIYLIAQSILAGHGFSYAIPSRAKGNQLYVPELDRIVLKDSASARPFASTSTCRKVPPISVAATHRSVFSGGCGTQLETLGWLHGLFVGAADFALCCEG